MRKQLQGWILISPLVAGCLLFYAIPFGLVLMYSMFQRVRLSKWHFSNHFLTGFQNQMS